MRLAKKQFIVKHKLDEGQEETEYELLNKVEEAVLRCIEDDVAPTDMGLIFIPDVVRYIINYDSGYDFTIDQVKEAVLGLARKRYIEIRPESGLNRLTKEELALCPILYWTMGPAHYSWCRIIY